MNIVLSELEAAELRRSAELMTRILDGAADAADDQNLFWDGKERLNAVQAAEHLGISLSTLYGYVKDNQIPYRKYGKRLIFDAALLNKYLAGKLSTIEKSRIIHYR